MLKKASCQNVEALKVLKLTLRLSRRHSNNRGITSNISPGAFGIETTAQARFNAARRISGSASPETSFPVRVRLSLAIGMNASPAEAANVARVSSADDWSISVF